MAFGGMVRGSEFGDLGFGKKLGRHREIFDGDVEFVSCFWRLAGFLDGVIDLV